MHPFFGPLISEDSGFSVNFSLIISKGFAVRVEVSRGLDLDWSPPVGDH